MASVPFVNFSLRQWAVLVALSAVFIVAAVVIASDEPSPSPTAGDETFDEILWCETANALSRWNTILDGSLAGDSLDELINLEMTLDEARSVAPVELRTDVARLFDYALLTVQAIERNDGDLDAGLADAKGNTDQNRVNEAIERVNDAVVACGHDPIIDISA